MKVKAIVMVVVATIVVESGAKGSGAGVCTTVSGRKGVITARVLYKYSRQSDDAQKRPKGQQPPAREEGQGKVRRGQVRVGDGWQVSAEGQQNMKGGVLEMRLQFVDGGQQISWKDERERR